MYLVGVSLSFNGPKGSQRSKVVEGAYNRNACKPINTIPVLMPPQLELWRTELSSGNSPDGLNGPTRP